MNRGIKYRKTVVNAILKGIEKGLPGPRAAQVVGVAASTYARWLGLYPEFAERVEQAEASYMNVLIDRVNDGTKTDPKLALDVLSRRFPKDWARASQQDARAGIGAGPIKVTMVFDRKETEAALEAEADLALLPETIEGELVDEETDGEEPGEVSDRYVDEV